MKEQGKLRGGGANKSGTEGGPDPLIAASQSETRRSEKTMRKRKRCK